MLYKISIIAVVLFASHCKNGTSNKPRVSTPVPALDKPDAGDEEETPVNTVESTEVNSNDIVDLTSDAEKMTLLKELNHINEKMCLRIEQMRTECSGSVRLISNGADRALGCTGSFSDNIRIQNTFTAILSGAGTYKLSANNLFESNRFTEGNSNIIWTPKDSADVVAPRLVDITSLRLIRTDGFDVDLANITLQILVNETQVISHQDFVAQPGDGYVQLSPKIMDQLRSDPACGMSQADIQALVDTAKEELDQLEAEENTLPALDSTILDTVSSDTADDTTDPASTNSTVNGRFSDNDIEAMDSTALAQNIELAQERNGILRKELLIDVNYGCYLNEDVTKFEISIDGAIDTSEPRISKERSNQVQSHALPNIFEFSFGGDFKRVVDVSKTGLFGAQGSITFTDANDRKIRDFEFLRINRKGASYYNKKVSTSGFLGFGKKTKYNWHERDIYKLLGITIRANDQVVYRQVGLNFAFQGGGVHGSNGLPVNPSFEWRVAPDDFVINEQYIKLKHRQDCTQGQ